MHEAFPYLIDGVIRHDSIDGSDDLLKLRRRLTISTAAHRVGVSGLQELARFLTRKPIVCSEIKRIFVSQLHRLATCH